MNAADSKSHKSYNVSKDLDSKSSHSFMTPQASISFSYSPVLNNER